MLRPNGSIMRGLVSVSSPWGLANKGALATKRKLGSRGGILDRFERDRRQVHQYFADMLEIHRRTAGDHRLDLPDPPVRAAGMAEELAGQDVGEAGMRHGGADRRFQDARHMVLCTAADNLRLG